MSMRNYIRGNYAMSDDDRDFESFKGGRILLGIIVGSALLLACVAVFAQTITAPTRVSDADWACVDASGATLSNHQRFDTAFVACYNNAAGAEIVGGRYRINRATAPPVEPPVEPPPPVTAPANLSGNVSPNATNPANSNIALTWDAVASTTEYEVYRCAGATCSNFAFVAAAPTASYSNTNLPPGLTLRYMVRVWKPTAGPYSAVFTVTTPAAPPPPATGSATLNWTAPTQNVDGSRAVIIGYRISYGTSADQLTQTIQVDAVTAHTVEGLASGTWHFGVSALAAYGESALSNIASKVIQ